MNFRLREKKFFFTFFVLLFTLFSFWVLRLIELFKSFDFDNMLKVDGFFTFTFKTWFIGWFVFITGLVGFDFSVLFVVVVVLFIVVVVVVVLVFVVVVVVVCGWSLFIFGWANELVVVAVDAVVLVVGCNEVGSANSYKATIVFNLAEKSSIHEFKVKKSCWIKSPEVARLFGSIINASYFLILKLKFNKIIWILEN